MLCAKKRKNDFYGFVYLITNVLNNKKYVGQTIHLPEIRWKAHIRSAKNGNTTHICTAIRKHALNANINYNEIFQLQILERVPWSGSALTRQKWLNALERMWISKLNTFHGYGYNHDEGGSNGKPSIFSRKKNSISHLGRKTWMCGKHHSEKTKLVLSQKCSGWQHSLDAKKQISNALKCEKSYRWIDVSNEQLILSAKQLYYTHKKITIRMWYNHAKENGFPQNIGARFSNWKNFKQRVIND